MDLSLTTRAWQALHDMGGCEHSVSLKAWREACAFLDQLPRRSKLWYDARERLRARGLIEFRGEARDRVRIPPGRTALHATVTPLLCGVCGADNGVRSDARRGGVLCRECHGAVRYAENADRAATYAGEIARYRTAASAALNDMLT